MKCCQSRQVIRKFSCKSSILNKGQNGEKRETSFIYNRLKQLAEDSVTIDESIHIDRDSLPLEQKTTPEIQKLIDKLEQKEYEETYSKEVAYNKIPEYLNKHSKEIALASPWKGSESVHDLNLRMLVDVNKPLKKDASTPLRRSRVSTRDRLHNAREGSLDYSLSKLSREKQSEDDDGWADRYRERLLGPELLGPTSVSGTINSIKALADRRIEDARSRGEFRNLPNRGKPLIKDYNASSPYIDTTEYHLNNILKRQEIVPPWIEKQNSVQITIDKFRNDLDKLWLKRAVLVIRDRNVGLSPKELMQKLLDYSRNEKEGTILLRDRSWIEEQDSYLTTKMNFLNDSIRGYNLQAPLASQKLYLLKDKELEAMFKRVNSSQLENGMKSFVYGDQDKEIKQIIPGSYLRYNELPQREDQESLGRLFFNMFKRSS